MVLEGQELAASADFIISGLRLKKYCTSVPEQGISMSGILSEAAEKIPDLHQCSDSIFKEINSDGTVKEDHPLLKSARAKIATLHKKISRISSDFISDDKGIWQNTVPSQRDGRIVLPLKTNYRGRVKGLVHEFSSSGATVYIEPFELVELNNQMSYEQNQLAQKVNKIYRSLTEKLNDSFQDFLFLIDTVSEIDSYYARAVHSIRNRCVRPVEIERGITINQGRHPALGSKAVPITISIKPEIKTLIITGPNAGGKTVTLKTCGIFILMNQFALELPAEEGTEIGLYTDIIADIGDDQSIEESLSTFSGHMKRISEILRKSDNRTMVLLDELGSGTDPVQGSAIASSVLEELLGRNVTTVVTTHHSAVKRFGYTRSGAANASVEFDSETMKPTYRIIEGVPGESHAVEIALSCGIDRRIIESAKKLIDDGDSSVESMIAELERRQREFLVKEKEQKDREAKFNEVRKKKDLEILKLRQQNMILKESEFGELKSFVHRTRSDLENLVRELREGEITREKNLKVKSFIETMSGVLEDEKIKLYSEKDSVDNAETGTGVSHVLNIELAEGMQILNRKTRKKGVLIEKRKNDEWIASFGNIKLNVKVKDIEPLAVDKKTENKISVASSGFDIKASFELDIRGMRVEEARDALERQLDGAILSSLNEFSVIHGLGDGILQKFVHDFLKKNRNVKEIFFSDAESGGFGKTIVKLK